MPYTLSDLRAIHDWMVRPQLRTVPGVVEVNAIGGYERQIHVVPDPYRLTSFNLSFADVAKALEDNNVNQGAGYIERNGEQYLIRLPGQLGDAAEFGEVLLGTHNGRPIYIHDVAEVTFGKELRTGAATHDGEETVLGTAVMLMGENSREVASAVRGKLKQIERNLPDGVTIETLYDRTDLVQKTIATVRNNLVEGAVLVIVVLFMLLRSIRAALITAAVIPLSMLIAVTGMVEYRISANLMSLGAIDFGLIVDGAVIITENCLRRLSEERKHLGRTLGLDERFAVVVDATREVITPAMFGSFIITVVYLPILTLTGVEGKMFTPMAVTVVLALLGAMALAVTFVPAAIAIFVRGDVEEKESLIMRWAQKGYQPALRFALGRQKTIAIAAAALVLVAALGATRFGTEFIPRLDEGDVAVQVLRMPGTSLCDDRTALLLAEPAQAESRASAGDRREARRHTGSELRGLAAHRAPLQRAHLGRPFGCRHQDIRRRYGQAPRLCERGGRYRSTDRRRDRRAGGAGGGASRPLHRGEARCGGPLRALRRGDTDGRAGGDRRRAGRYLL